MQIGGARAVFVVATPWFPLVSEWRPRRQPVQQGLRAGNDPARRHHGATPAGDQGIWLQAKMLAQSLIEAVLDARDTTDSLDRRQFVEPPIAQRILQRGQGENSLDQRAFVQDAFRGFDADQIVDQLRRLARRRREFGRLGLAEIESADGALVLRNERALIEGCKGLAASGTTIEQTSSMSTAGHDAGAAPLLPEIRCLVLGEARRAELLPRRMFLVGAGSAERQEQRPTFLGADRHGRDPVVAKAGLMMQQVQHEFRQGEIEPRRPCAGADAEAFPEVARRQAMSESTAMQCARQQLMVRGNHLQWS